MVRTCKCPNCGGAVLYNADKKTLYCDSCSSEFAFEQYQQMVVSAQEEHRCPVCGADYGEEGLPLAARICNYCGAPALIGSNLSGEKEPKRMVPFTVSKTKAMEIFRERIQKCHFSPSNLHQSSTLEKVKGIYVPYWFFQYDAQLEAKFHAMRVRKEERGDTITTITEHFDVYRNLEAAFDNLPVDGMIEMEDSIMETLEPYNQLSLERFEEGALLGYEANVYTENAKSCEKEAERRIHACLTQEAAASVVGYESVQVVSRNLQAHCRGAVLGFCPVWRLQFRFRNTNYDLYVNGQTGKFVGEIPISKGKVAGVWGILFVICMFLTGIMFL